MCVNLPRQYLTSKQYRLEANKHNNELKINIHSYKQLHYNTLNITAVIKGPVQDF